MTRRTLTPNERARLKMSRELLRGPYRNWASEREEWFMRIESGEAFYLWAPGEAAREAFELHDRVYLAALRNVEEFG